MTAAPEKMSLSHQNILKRTAPGSQDEDMATKAFSALKEVSSGIRAAGSWGPFLPLVEAPLTPHCHPQLVQECNASVQSMKRTEELIHLSKKIHFEGKARESYPPSPGAGVGW